METTVGVIGIGNMGKYYVQRLLDAGYTVFTYDIVPDNQRWASQAGAQVKESPYDITQHCTIILLALPSHEEIAKVVAHDGRLLEGLTTQHIVVNTSTTHPEQDASMAELCQAEQRAWLDAPVTWREKGLIIMVGGKTEHFERALPILQTLAYKVVYIGESGMGQRMKAVNQLILANQLAVWSEAAEFARAIGIDPVLIRDVLELPIPDAVLGEEFSGGGQLALHFKDLGYIMDIAHKHGAAIPLTSFVHEVFKATKHYGNADWTQPGIVTFWRRLNRGSDD